MEADGVSDYLNFAIPADFQDLSSFLAYVSGCLCVCARHRMLMCEFRPFRLLETKKKELGITDVLVSLTTLEEVFLRITEEAENRGEQDDDGSDDDIDDDDDMPISPKAVEVLHRHLSFLFALSRRSFSSLGSKLEACVRVGRWTCERTARSTSRSSRVMTTTATKPSLRAANQPSWSFHQGQGRGKSDYYLFLYSRQR
jgi:hypothetical protein